MRKAYSFSKPGGEATVPPDGRRAALPLILGLCLWLLGPGLVAFGQSRTVTGKVTSAADNTTVPGVTVLVKGTTSGTATDANGNYSLSVPGNDAVLVFSFIGFVTEEVPVAGRTTVDVQMASDVQALQEVVVTGYSTERKRDIIGSVAVVKPTELLSTPAANLQAQLQGRAAGVTVSGNGAPGAGARVRIRGFASFGNNDPLYVIDGVPTSDPSQLNPQDIESMQVLKDATAASIYGSRAANGVIIITTRQGKAGTAKITVDSYVGMQTIPRSTFPEMLNTGQYGEYLWRVKQGAGLAPSSVIYGSGATPEVPAYLLNSAATKGGVAAGDPRITPDLYNITTTDPTKFYQLMQTSPGTNWFEEVTRPALIQSHQISASGGGEKGTYALGLNYFDQQGTFQHTGYKRYTVRANTVFKPRDHIRLGENLQVSYNSRQGGSNFGQDGAWASAYRMMPYLPVYDINGGFAGNAVGESGNGSNPIANLYRDRNDKNYGYKIFGNVFAEVDLFKRVTARTSFGLDYGNNYEQDLASTTYERAENIRLNTYTERFGYGYSWTWTNTLQFQQTFADLHSVKALVGLEAIAGNGLRMVGSVQGLGFAEDPNFWSLNVGTEPPQLTNEWADPYALYSQFARVDYAFGDKYLLNATVRRDGSSKFGTENRFGVFPAIGLGWRLSGESFMQNIGWITDLKLRAGWGQMGSQKNVPGANAYSYFQSGRSDAWYDIGGSGTSATVGYRPQRLGNISTKWEATETTNFGVDASLFGGKLDVTLEAFNINTKGLLVERQRNPLEIIVDQPRINVGTMRNRGIDATVGTRGTVGSDFRYDATLTFTHYTNKAVKLNNEGAAVFDRGGQRSGTISRTQEGYALSSFFGYQIDGIFQNQEEVDAGPEMPYKQVGSWRIKDISGDGRITEDDRTFLGSPIPDFQTGLNLSAGYRNFDVTAFLFWNYGNELYNFTKWFTDLRGFVGGVSTRVLEDSWTPENRDATLPVLNQNDSYSSSITSSYYVESGSYLRLRNLQVGYTVPKAAAGKLGLENVRVYVQGQNLFTITKYSGADPDVNIQSDNANEELLLGVDQAGFPQARQFILGVNVGF